MNVHVFPGRNISADLRMEHMNRTVITIIQGLGTNKTDNAITRAGKRDHLVIFWLHLMVRQGWLQSMAKHAEKSELKDLYQIVDQLMESEVIDGALRNHKSFLKLKANITRILPEMDLKKRIINNFLNMLS